jgi:RNA polymerase subunit RPABC4/transcription elongation factor Spt4
MKQLLAGSALNALCCIAALLLIGGILLPACSGSGFGHGYYSGTGWHDPGISSVWHGWFWPTFSFVSFWFFVQVILGVWVGMDAQRRGMNGLLWGLLVFFTCIVGLLVYLIVVQAGTCCPPRKPARPPAAGAGGGEGSCGSCGSAVQAEFKVCPYCGSPLDARCPACSRPVQAAWKVCPHCERSLARS